MTYPSNQIIVFPSFMGELIFHVSLSNLGKARLTHVRDLPVTTSCASLMAVLLTIARSSELLKTPFRAILFERRTIGSLCHKPTFTLKGSNKIILLFTLTSTPRLHTSLDLSTYVEYPDFSKLHATYFLML